jgi:hypothetical protein
MFIFYAALHVCVLRVLGANSNWQCTSQSSQAHREAR